MRVGYIRVSTFEQNIARQLENIEVDKTFIDKASGKDCNRQQFKMMMEFVREGDKVFVHSMDRMARNLMNLKDIVNSLVKNGVEITFVKENLTFNGNDSPMSNFLLSVMGAFGEFEHQLIRERQKEGIEIAKANGVYKGRSKALTEEMITELKAMTDIQGMKKSYICHKFKISRMTLYNYLKNAK